MERKQGGCCLVPRQGGQQAAGMSWQMGRIMLKFRPIAPKPAAMAPVPTPAPVAAAASGAGRGKRKAVGGGGGRRGRKPKKAATVAPVKVAPVAALQVAAEKEKSLSSRSSSSSAMTSEDSSPPSPPASQQPATLPLMPVSPAAEERAVASTEDTAPVDVPVPAARAQQLVAPRPMPPAATTSCVTVEDVTSTWRDGEAPSAAVAAASACGVDGDAPAFVSDLWGRVTWANPAFTRAVSDDDGGDGETWVGLAGALPAWGTCAGFTCRVRVRHTAGSRSVVAPCDVWRLDASGCYLWRLDLQAALTLGGLP